VTNKNSYCKKGAKEIKRNQTHLHSILQSLSPSLMCVKSHVKDMQKSMFLLFSSFLSSLKKQERNQLEDFSSNNSKVF
jgi:hypothetical protein